MAKGKYEYWQTDDGLLLLSAWARNGLTDEQIAHNMGIAAGTLYEWKKRFPEINESLKKNKEIADIEVENALHKSALGYSYNEIKEEYGAGGVLLSRTVTTKQVQPNTTAQIFWLKNRDRDNWSDRRAIEHSGTVGNPYKDLTTEELRKLIGEDDGG